MENEAPLTILEAAHDELESAIVSLDDKIKKLFGPGGHVDIALEMQMLKDAGAKLALAISDLTSTPKEETHEPVQ